MAILMENYVPGTPEIPEEDLKEAFRGMTDYIFVTNEPDGSKTFLCSRCGEKYNLRFPARTYTNAEEELFRAKHREYGTCTKAAFPPRLSTRVGKRSYRIYARKRRWLLYCR